jgi:hypothetical protein
MRNEYQRHGGLDIESIYDIVSGLKATVPHDYVYGLKGLLKSEVSARIPVEYERSYLRAFQTATISVLQVNPQTAFQYIGITSLLHNDPDIPSWVPDLTKMKSSTVDEECFWFTKAFLSSFLRLKELQVAFLMDDINIINVSGIEIDVVAEIYSKDDVLKLHSTSIGKTASEESTEQQQGYFPSDAILELERRANKALPESPSRMLIEQLKSERVQIESPNGTATWEELNSKTMIVSEAGFAGISMVNIRKGDTIAWFFGMQALIILRKVEQKDGYVIIARAEFPTLMLGIRDNIDIHPELFQPMNTSFNIY